MENCFWSNVNFTCLLPAVTHLHSCTDLPSCCCCVSDGELVYQADAGSRSPTLNWLSQNFPMGKPIMSAGINHGEIPQGSPFLEQDVTEMLLLPAHILAVSL